MEHTYIFRNYQTMAERLQYYAKSHQCIKGSKIILRSSLKIAINQQRKMSKELCENHVKNFIKWSPYLQSVAPETHRALNETVLRCQQINEQETGQLGKLKKVVWLDKTFLSLFSK